MSAAPSWPAGIKRPAPTVAPHLLRKDVPEPSPSQSSHGAARKGMGFVSTDDWPHANETDDEAQRATSCRGVGFVEDMHEASPLQKRPCATRRGMGSVSSDDWLHLDEEADEAQRAISCRHAGFGQDVHEASRFQTCPSARRRGSRFVAAADLPLSAEEDAEQARPITVFSTAAVPRGGQSNTCRSIHISKALGRILRHTAQSLGLQIRGDGFCQLQDILALDEFTTMAATVEDVQVAVQCDSKKRLEMKIEADKVLIRAVNGHSMKAVDDDSLLKRLNAEDPNLPKVCVHGTYKRHVASIQRNGLRVGGRNHVHFAPYEPHDGRVLSGMRSNCEVAIYIDLPTAIREGVPFFQSGNEVILSPGINGTVPAKYISKVGRFSTSLLRT